MHVIIYNVIYVNYCGNWFCEYTNVKINGNIDLNSPYNWNWVINDIKYTFHGIYLPTTKCHFMWTKNLSKSIIPLEQFQNSTVKMKPFNVFGVIILVYTSKFEHNLYNLIKILLQIKFFFLFFLFCSLSSILVGCPFFLIATFVYSFKIVFIGKLNIIQLVKVYIFDQ